MFAYFKVAHSRNIAQPDVRMQNKHSAQPSIAMTVKAGKEFSNSARGKINRLLLATLNVNLIILIITNFVYSVNECYEGSCNFSA